MTENGAPIRGVSGCRLEIAREPVKAGRAVPGRAAPRATLSVYTTMSAADPVQIVRAADWLAETVRITLFPSPGVSVNPEPWWRAVTGVDPETRTTKPATREYMDAGPFHKHRLRLTVNPLGVIQWEMLPSEP